MVLERIRYASDPLPTDLSLGRRLFHSAANTKIVSDRKVACGICHTDGGSDGLVWNLAQGRRNPPMLAGGRLIDTEPLNWDGDKDSLEDNLVRSVTRMGGTGLTETETSALAAYLRHGLPEPIRPKDGRRLNAQEARGMEIFHRSGTGCVGCHTPPMYTDRMRHQITPDGFLADTPSLIGVGLSAPYFHDGSQPDLGGLLRWNQGYDVMGATSHLSGQDIEDLTAFLETL